MYIRDSLMFLTTCNSVSCTLTKKCRHTFLMKFVFVEVWQKMVHYQKCKGEGRVSIKEGNFRLCSNRTFWCRIPPYVMQIAESFFKTNSHTPGQEIPCFLWHQKVQYCVLSEVLIAATTKIVLFIHYHVHKRPL
jgi:hypothetical protein